MARLPRLMGWGRALFLGQDEARLLGEAEIFRAGRVGAQRCAVGLVGCEAVEGDQRDRDVVGAQAPVLPFPTLSPDGLVGRVALASALPRGTLRS